MENYSHDILIFATDIHTEANKKLVSKILDEREEIISWNIDQEDKDRVLRIVSINILPNQIIELISFHNFKCKELE